MISLALSPAKSLWSYNPIPKGCVLYLPLWHPSLRGASFQGVDPYRKTVTPVGVTKVAKGFYFDGVNDHIVLPANWMPSTGTIIIWADYQANGTYLFSCDGNQISFYQTATYIQFYYSSAAKITCNKNWVVGTYYCIAVTFAPGAGNNIVYIDGAYANQEASHATPPTNVATWLGEGTGGTLDYTGTIPEVAIYNRILSAGEVLYYNNKSYPRRFK